MVTRDVLHREAAVMITTNDFHDLDALLRQAMSDAEARRDPKERLKDSLLSRLQLEPVRNYIRSEEKGGKVIGSRGCFYCGANHLSMDCESV